jgi:hypothetical protein
MARSRTTKTIAKRIDLGYFKRSHPLRWWRRVLTWGAGLIALVGIAIPSLRISQGKVKVIDAIHNPGPVSTAHALFQNDCAKCHTPNPGGDFKLAVSDASCVACHQGAIHHVNAVQAHEQDLVSYKRRVLALKDPKNPDDPSKGRSAGCATCHIEHRGHELLAATSDAHCLVCHENLTAAAIEPDKVKSPSTVRAFDASNHPAFGRSFRAKELGGQWVDPTVLAFNHQMHLTNPKAVQLAANACAVCHTTSNPPTVQTVGERQLPTLVAGKDPVGAWQNVDGRGYMQPISYQRHCSACHALNLPESLGRIRVGRNDLNLAQVVKTVSLSHSDMSLVRKEIELELTKAMSVGESGFTKKPRTGAAQKMTEGEWIAENMKYLAEDLNKNLASLESEIPKGAKPQHNLKYKDAKVDVPDPSSAASQPTMNRGVLVDYYVANVAFNVCGKCHGIEGELPKLDGSKSAPLATVPTGIPSVPRHRFAAARFDHDAHRQIVKSCVDCHYGVTESMLTSQISLPDLHRATPGAQTCVDCHHNAESGPGSAPATCVTCHAFHDRIYERPAALALPTPASQPAQ